MDKTQLKRHDMVYPSSIGRARLKQVFLNELTGEKAFLAADIFRADSVIPGIVRRAEVLFGRRDTVGLCASAAM